MLEGACLFTAPPDARGVGSAAARYIPPAGGTQFPRFTGTPVQILTLYWYKSTNTDLQETAAGKGGLMARAGGGCLKALCFFAVLLWLLRTASCQRQKRGTNSERRGLPWRRKRLSECGAGGAGGAGRRCSSIEQRDPSPREARGCRRRQQTSAYVSIRQHTSCVSIRLRDPSPRETRGCIR